MGAGKFFGIVGFVVAVLIGITVLFGSWYTVDVGYRGIVLRNGAFVSVAEPGLNFKTPWIESVAHISIRDNVRQEPYKGMAAYSRDQQEATINISVNYRIPSDRVVEVYTNYGSEENLLARVLDRQILDKVKTVFGQFNAETSIRDRARLNAEVTESVIDSISGPIIITSIQIEDITFSPAYESAIEERMKQEVEVRRLEEQAKQAKVRAEIKVTEANAIADSLRATALAEAESTKIRGEAEAQSIQSRGDALRNNPGIIALTQAEKWNGQLPTSMIPNGAVPILNLQQN